MRIVVVVGAAGRGGDEAARRSCQEALADAQVVWRGLDQDSLGRCDAVVVVADAPTPPAIAAPLRAFAERGAPVLGLGGGFRLLTRIGLLDGSFVDEGAARAEVAEVHLLVEGRPTPFTFALPAGRILRLPWDGSAGRYQHLEPDALEREARVVLRHADASGGRSERANPHGATAAIAGITNAAGNVVGLAPAALAPVASAPHDGRLFFASLLLHLGGRGGRV